ncbi:hypothetical protein BVRB_6g131630 [Beta vulgaris subsp. vulgaris]|nr:hypothetical protein BVRB_6g131630 [Beta vulgaris subsp. vulgaris]
MVWLDILMLASKFSFGHGLKEIMTWSTTIDNMKY